MKKENFLKDIQEKVGELLENTPVKELQKNMKALITQQFSKLDIVTSEDFDIQAQVLARTRQKLEMLEKKVAELEQKLGTKAN